jgi:hypothetical protein
MTRGTRPVMEPRKLESFGCRRWPFGIRWQDQSRSGGRARNQHSKRLPHLAHSQRCRESASCTADPSDTDSSTSQRMIEGTSLSAAMLDDRFRPNLVVPRPASDSPKQSFTKLGCRLQSARPGRKTGRATFRLGDICLDIIAKESIAAGRTRRPAKVL